jgi:hypothetical protein
LCACSGYRAGSFRTAVAEFPSERATQGCVDLALRAAIDPLADGPVVDLYLGNRCKDSVWVDIPKLAMSAYLEDGKEMPVTFYDPRDELRAAVLGGKEQTMVRLELVAPLESLRVCARLDQLARARDVGPPKQLCTPVEGGA